MAQRNTLQRRGSIRPTLITAFILAVLAPAVLINLITLAIGLRDTEKQTLDQLRIASTLKTAQIDQWMEQQHTRLESIVLTDADFTKTQIDWAVSDKLSTKRVGVQSMNTLFLDSVRGMGGFDRLSLLDPTGLIVASNDILVRDTVDAAFSTLPQQAGILPPVFDPELNRTIVRFYLPVDARSTGEYSALVVGETSLDSLLPLLEAREGLGDTGETYLVNEAGALLTPVIKAEAYPPGSVIETDGKEAAFSGTSTHNYTGYQGQPVIGVQQHIPGLHAALIAEKNVGESQQAIVATMVFSAGATLLAVLVVIVFALMFTNRRIVRPLERITLAARRIADGKLETELPQGRSDEIGVLADALMTMKANLGGMLTTEKDLRHDLQHTVSEYVNFIERVSAGNLTYRIPLDTVKNGAKADDDLLHLGQSLNTMVDRLAAMTAQIHATADTLAAASEQIYGATAEQLEATTRQSSALSETSASVTEVRAIVSQTAEIAESVTLSAQQSVSVSHLGRDAIDSTIEGMGQIRELVSAIAQNILALAERTQKIGDIITTVAALADQSNLLALNASIEAARAGENGRGFAVVAQEVRQLAEQSRAAASQVAVLLEEIQQATNAAVMVTEEGSKGVDTGMTLADNAGQAIRELAATIEEAARAAISISGSTGQQLNGTDELAVAIDHIHDASRQNANLAQATQQSAGELMDAARRLRAAAEQYTI